MKTLRALRNVAALFIFGMAPLILQPSTAQADSHHPHCAYRDLLVNCTKVKNSCFTGTCSPGSPCNHSVCVL